MPSRILLVDDSEHVTGALRVLLEATEREVQIARTVAEAVRACREHSPDLVLLDLTLPDGDGLEVLHALRAEGGTPPPTAALTGHDDPETRRRCADAGCLATLVKPVPTRELLRLLDDWLDGPGGAST